jgi:hypothetical protein
MKIRVLPWVSVCTLLIVMSVSPQSARAADIFEGVQNSYDYLMTIAGTNITIGGTTIPLMGIPDPTQFGADTVVKRFQDAVIPDLVGASATVNTQMFELNLTSAPGAVMGLTMMVGLTPGTSSLGQMTFTQDVVTIPEGTTEGPFTSFFDVSFSLSFINPSNNTPVPCTQILAPTVCTQTVRLTGSGRWSDDNIFTWLIGPASYSAQVENHVVMQIPVSPEPASVISLVGGLAALAVVRLRRRQK